MASRFKRSVPVTVNDVLDGHVALDLECLDRVYLHGYLGRLQVSGQVIQFLTHRGFKIYSAACLQQIGDGFRRRVASFAEANDIPMVTLKAADRNIEVMRPHLDKAAASGRSQVAAIGVAQEVQRVFLARQRDTDPSKPPQFSFGKKDRRVTVYYFYLWDAGFGDAFIKVCTYCPWPMKIWVNGHEWAKQQARKAGLGFTELSNGFASCEDPALLQRICDVLQPGTIEVFFQRWPARLPRPDLALWINDERPAWKGSAHTSALLLNHRGARLGARGADDILGAIADEAHLTDGFTSHVLRHTFGTTLVRQGHDLVLVLVAELMGHKRLDQTRRYSLPTQANGVALSATDARLCDVSHNEHSIVPGHSFIERC